MRSFRRVTFWIALALIAHVPAALAVRAPENAHTSELGTATRPASPDPMRQAELDRSPAWAAFRAAHGDWRALWNERAGTPHLAFGPSFPLPGFAADPAALDRALRRFMAANPGLMGGVDPATLETLRVRRAGAVWYAGYRRRLQDIPVLFEDWEFRVDAGGRLMAFGVDATPAPAGPVAFADIGAEAARAAARGALGLAPGAPVEGGENLYWFPDEREGLRLVREVRARLSDPPASWIALVDAADGSVRWLHDRVRHQVQGTVTGSVHLDLPTGTPVSSPFARLRVTLNAATAVTDATGSYSGPGTGTVTVSAGIAGEVCNVNRNDAPDATFSTQVTAPATVNVSWTDANSHPAERDGYYHVTLAHGYLKALDPGFTGNDYIMPCTVNIADVCNAYWDGTGVNFYAAGGGCPNTATMPDVVYHEYGHGVNDNLYADAGSPFGMINGALHEGLADVLAAFIQDEPLMGKGFFGPGTHLRNVDNTARWPEDRSGDPHVTGLIVAGAFWDLRQAVGLAVAEQLSHFAKYGVPDDSDDGVAMGEYFVATLVADDDNGNLGDGTPHDDQIIAAFNAHGIGTGNFIQIAHAPLADQAGTGPHTVSATISYGGPVGSLDPASPRLHYSVNGSPFGEIPMASVGSGQFEAQIPGRSQGTILRYYLSAADSYGQSRSDPLEPAARTHLFLSGPITSGPVHDHESNFGWSASAPGDDAVTGQWEWTAPDGSFIGSEPVQPGEDHTPTGILCYVTRNPTTDYSPGAHDVDGGRTTLTTSVFDGTTLGPDPLIEYWRWYTNDLGASPGTDTWRTEITNDLGGSWTPVENTMASDNSWRRAVFFVRDFVEPTEFMRMRFIASDYDPGSLVEAAVDDFRLLRFDVPVTAVASVAPARLALAPPAPNPSRGAARLRFTLDRPGPVELSVHDLQGRAIRVLERGERDPGEHAATWDGRDASGRPAPSGLYLVRLRRGAETLTRRLLLAR